MIENKNYDAVIIGGSYAGLSAAMSLGRALFNVLILDTGNPCNKQTPHSHNFLTQDGMPPASITEIALKQVLSYPTVSFAADKALNVTGTNGHFLITTASGAAIRTKKLLFSSGIKDIMPAIEGFADCWGISAVHCPYCHGYEYRGKNTGILINGDEAADFGEFISNWAGSLSIFTNGKSSIPAEKQGMLANRNIRVIEKEIQSIRHTNGYIESLVFADGSMQALDVLYARLAFVQHCKIPEVLGCRMTEAGYIDTDEMKKTSIAGVFAAGDNISPMRSVAGAVAAGNFAGAVISKELIKEKLDYIGN